MKKNLIYKTSIIAILTLFISCQSKAEKQQIKKEIATKQNATIINNQFVKTEIEKNQNKLKEYIQKMPLEQKVAQLFIENLEGNTKFRSYETYDKITGKKEHSNISIVAGGYIYFSYNLCQTPEQQIAFAASIYEYCNSHNQIYPFLAIDQEGGFVNRLRKLTGGLPSQQKVSQDYSVEQAYDLYKDQAQKMSALGFHMNIAPVIEISTDFNKEFLSDRSFGNYNQVVNYGRACINAYETNKIATVVKHFPGNTNTDPHVGLPVIELSKDELEDFILSFKTLLEYNPTSILMSHAISSAIDNGVPACLSKVWITDILRKEYNYKGIIFSDDIFMAALAKNGYPPEKAAVMAIEAGVDCIMISEKRIAKSAKIIYEKAMEDQAFKNRIDESVQRILEYKIKTGLFDYEK